MRARCIVIVCALAGCRIGFDAQLLDADATPDAAIDAETFGPWQPAQGVSVASTAMDEQDGALSSDGLELVFAVQPDTDTSGLYITTRPTLDGAWSARTALSVLNDLGGNVSEPRFSLDNSTLYFSSDVGTRQHEVYASTRASRTEPFTAPQLVTAVNTPGEERWFSPCVADRYVIVRGLPPEQLYEGVLGGDEHMLTTLDTSFRESSPWLAPDCLSLYFQSDRDGSLDLYVTTRATPTDDWG